jgi:ethanolamine utilization protein EutN
MLIAKMQLARVIGTVVATVKNDSLEGRKLLVVQSLNADLKPQGKPLVALDAIGAGIGELVVWCRGKEASFPFKREDTPTDCTVIAIVDSEQHVTNGRRRG